MTSITESCMGKHSAESLLAPVIVFAYKRSDKLKNCLNALESNDCHDAVDLYVFSDGKNGKEDNDEVSAVRSYLKEYEKNCTFRKIHIIYREKHYGLANNVICGVTQVIEEYGRVVVVEDDLIVSRDFISYINCALEYYEKDTRIWSVTGYTEPLRALSGYKHDVYYGYRGCSYGWGTWKNRWDTVDWEVKDYQKILKSPILQWKLNRSGNSMMGMLRLQMDGKIDSWAIRWCLAQSKQNKYTIYPKNTLIYDDGADGSGTHVSRRKDMRIQLNERGKPIQLETLRPNILVTVEYWYKHSDTMIKKLRRNRMLRKGKAVFLEIREKIRRVINRNKQIKKNTEELLWANIYSSTVKGSEWLVSGISPGRWAVGFPYLYVMYRTLNEVRPEMILEIGTGQTTRMISDYLAWNKDARHIAVEQDEDWADYVKKNVNIDRSDFLIMPVELRSESINGNTVMATHYTGFMGKISEAVKKQGNRKISFISVDGPSTLYGQANKVSARRDVLNLIPELIADDFVILVDDIDRTANRKFVTEIKDRFRSEGINAVSQEYWGQKGMAVITVEKYKWLLTM